VALWLVRAGKGGKFADIALEQGLAGIGWAELPDLSQITTRAQLEALYRERHPGDSPQAIGNNVGQVWAFYSRVKPGDLVGLPISSRSVIAIGTVVGPYEHRPDLPQDLRHARRVEWLRPGIPRTDFDQDLLGSFGSLLTVAQIQRNNAEERIRAMIEGRKPRADESPPSAEAGVPQAEQAPLNLEEYARDQIQSYISRKFRGHGLARLVTAILTAQGYTTETAQPGPDGGVDIVAGQGPMGFDPPRFGAQQGLLVSWGGFKSSVQRESRQIFFQIRLWHARDVVDALLEHYDQLPEDLRAELPLKRIWTLVLEE
jgi:restriction system protein